jgi:hypothetical protein
VSIVAPATRRFGTAHGTSSFACAALVLLLASRAHAHGPAPAVLEVLQVDANGRPTLLRTSVGLAEARGDGTYGYLCPSLWSGNELARSFVTNDGSVVVIDAGSLWRSDPNRARFERDEELEASFAVRDVATDGRHVFVLARERLPSGLGRSALFALGDSPTFLDDHPTDLAIRDGEPLASAPTPSLCAREGCTTLAHDAVDLLAIRAVEPDALFLLATTDTRCLLRVPRDGDELGAVDEGPCGERVLGPVWLGGQRVAIVDGVAYDATSTGWRELDGLHPWTSLDSVDGHVLASTLDGVFRLDGSLDASTLVFRFVQLGGPRAEHEELCTLDWAHFGGESGWVETAPADTPDGERQTDAPSASGCSIASPGAPPMGARRSAAPSISTLAIVLVIARRSLARRRPPAQLGPEDRAR